MSESNGTAGGKVAKGRGFWAEIQHQNRQAEAKRKRAQAQQARTTAAAHRQAEQARKAAERGRAVAARASAAEQKQQEAEAKRLYAEARIAEAEALTQDAAERDEAIAGILAATLDVDDYVDLETLRQTPVHPPFDAQGLDRPLSPPPPLPRPAEPVFVEPPPPTGLGKLFGKKEHTEQLRQAQDSHAAAYAGWLDRVAQLPAQNAAAQEAVANAERARQAQLRVLQERYRYDCLEREKETAQANQKLDQLIAGLARRENWAVQEYVEIVLGNSVYPDEFPVDSDHSFDVDARELAVRIIIPAPQDIPVTKVFKYVKTKDEITQTELSARDQAQRYQNAVAQTVLRTAQEIFEADRAGHIDTLSLVVSTETVDPATGRDISVDLAGLATDRNTFMALDLARVEPLATLKHLGAVISKNSIGLVPVALAGDVRL